MKEEIEYIAYPKLKHVKVFLDEVKYRNQHLHPEIELCFMLKGEGLFKTSKKEFLLKENDILLLNGNEAHSIESIGESALGLFIQVSNHFLREYIPILRNEIFESTLLSQYFDQTMLKQLFDCGLQSAKSYFKEEKYYQFDVISNLAKIFQCLLNQLPHVTISEKERERNKKNSARIAQVISYIDEHLQEKMKLSDIAEAEGISTTYLSHLFSDDFGMNFQDYVNSKRFEEALRLISEGGRTMLEVSIEAGFSDQKYMTKMFTEKLGMTPKVFASKNEFVKLENNKKNRTDILERIYSSQESMTVLEHYL